MTTIGLLNNKVVAGFPACAHMAAVLIVGLIGTPVTTVVWCYDI